MWLLYSFICLLFTWGIYVIETFIQFSPLGTTITWELYFALLHTIAQLVGRHFLKFVRKNFITTIN